MLFLFFFYFNQRLICISILKKRKKEFSQLFYTLWNEREKKNDAFLFLNR